MNFKILSNIKLVMTFGIFNKIKKGLAKVLDFGKRIAHGGASFVSKVNDNFVKPTIDLANRTLPQVIDIYQNTVPKYLDMANEYSKKVDSFVKPQLLANDRIQPQFR